MQELFSGLMICRSAVGLASLVRVNYYMNPRVERKGIQENVRQFLPSCNFGGVSRKTSALVIGLFFLFGF
jgi:hypothetical protein